MFHQEYAFVVENGGHGQGDPIQTGQRGFLQSSFDHCGNLPKPLSRHLHRPEKNLQGAAEKQSSAPRLPNGPLHHRDVFSTFSTFAVSMNEAFRLPFNMSVPGCILSPIIQEAICSGQQLQNEEAFFFFFFFEGVCMCDVYKMPSQ